ncbi:MAG: MFS transporter, partial [Candidatus Thorarchaeota archaeon]
IFFFVGYGAQFFFMKMRPKMGMRKLILRFGLAKVILTLLLFIFIVFIDNSLIVVITLAILTFLGGYTIFNTPILYLSIDEDELKTGSRREGMFFGIDALIHKPSQSIGPIVATFILGIFGYVQNSTVQTDSAIIGIKILMFLIPTIVSAIGLLFMYFHPLHGEKLDKLKENLELLHQTKRERLA